MWTLVGSNEGYEKDGIEHFSLLYKTWFALDEVESLAVMHELDAELRFPELDSDLERMTYCKAPESHGIPLDLLKQCKK